VTTHAGHRFPPVPGSPEDYGFSWRRHSRRTTCRPTIHLSRPAGEVAARSAAGEGAARTCSSRDQGLAPVDDLCARYSVMQSARQLRLVHGGNGPAHSASPLPGTAPCACDRLPARCDDACLARQHWPWSLAACDERALVLPSPPARSVRCAPSAWSAAVAAGSPATIAGWTRPPRITRSRPPAFDS